MKVKVLFTVLAICALLAACENSGGDDGSFTVTFDKNGGTSEAEPRTIKVMPPAATIDTLPAPPARTDHTFTGWNVQADGSGEVFSADTEITDNITVYAQWLDVPEGSFVVTFNRNGGKTDANPVSKVVTPPATTIDALPAEPTWPDHTFYNWNTKADGSGGAFTASTEVTASITVYAQWSEGASPANPISPITYRNLFKELGGKTDAEVTAKVQGAYDKLFSGTETQKIYYEVAGDMAYILDSGNNDVRSEGMSYGMMMAVQMDDKTKFDKLWKWARTNMYNDRNVNNTGKNIRGFFAWQCGTDGSKKDNAPAADGEFYFVTALLFASARWGDGSGINEYGREARNIMYDMLHRFSGTKDNWGAVPMINPTHKVPEFTTVSSQHTDPSYILPAFYDVWAVEIEEGENYWDIWGGEAAAKTDAAYWREVATAGREFFKKTVNKTTGLGPDYATWTGAGTGGNHADFEYDAWRIAMNIGMDYAWWQKDPWQVEFADTIQAFFESKGLTTYGSLWTLTGSLKNNNKDHSPGLVACNAVASFAASNAARRLAFINDFWNISMTSGQYRYYDGCLYMLSLLHVSGNFKVYYPANRPRSSNIAPTAATFDKKAGAQADVAVTMTLNGNTLSNIKNGSATLTAGTHYTVSGSTVTIKKEYLAQQPNGTTTLTFTFSAGQARTIAINIGDTTAGGPIGGTVLEYTFNSDVTVTFAPSGSTSTAVRKVNNGANVLEVAIQAKDDVVILPFNLGSATLANYTSLYVEVASISGDSTFKSFVAQVSLTGTFGKGDSSNNTVIARQDGNALGGNNSWGTYTIPLQNKTSPTLTGPVNIAFWLPNANPGAVYQIRVLRLIP